MLNPEVVAELMLEVEREDPIDFGMLAIDEKEAARTIALSVLEMYERNINNLAGEEREYAIASTIGKLVLENFVLNAQLHQRMHGA